MIIKFKFEVGSRAYFINKLGKDDVKLEGEILSRKYKENKEGSEISYRFLADEPKSMDIGYRLYNSIKESRLIAL